MRLGIPEVQMLHIFLTAGLGMVGIGIGGGKGAKQFAPPFAIVKPIGRVYAVPRFMAKDAHALGLRAIFNLKHLSFFQLCQSPMSQIKRHGYARHTIRGKPFAA
jgi:hypothetical protein